MPVIPSPNIWHWPDVYELENRAQDVDGAVFAALAEVADWADRDVADIGCGSGFHLPAFGKTARSVVGVEPYRPLIPVAARRIVAMPNVRVVQGSAETIPLEDGSTDVVHARTAYFFGAGCEPGIAEAMRILRPGGVLVIVDLDATAYPYGEWMRVDIAHYRPDLVERFFANARFECRRVDTRWEFPNRDAMAEVLRIEFTPRTAKKALRSTPGTSFDVRYRIHTLRKPSGLILS
ncbi:class I SAM-dependent methyltransferase [Antrihabitans cavernicola]|uniref:Class I SAM-dependent methyltransferase n=1 Tax=Antrihabitans cavernicola TaxID=2495913 RepID=A0A5A7SCE0_9NOCA|nr:class I SAM-dependent methyltransferase [Spelaeibacter cavernicola]KAA0023234.1 class I SAM-dependent methyltransferase [Spelaeibacter cavernicola]